MITFEVPGDPVAKGRVRATRQGRFYTPEKTVRYESTVALFAAQAMEGRPALAGPLTLEIEATFSWPLSWSEKKRAQMPFKTSKPDADNIAKAAADAMNGIVYLDDAAVVRLVVKKKYGERAGLRVCVKPIEGADNVD